MAEFTFPVSPGVVIREIDLSGPTQITPTGIPAGVIGTSVRGPAFVPVTLATFQDFISVFGNSDGERAGPLAMREWLRNANAGTYVKVLGAGDGNTRTVTGNNQGKVTNAGFVAGDELVQSNGYLGPNSYAGSTTPSPGMLGRVHILAAFMSESAGSTIFSDAGIQMTAAAHPIIRGVLMAPSGVILALSSNLEPNNLPKANAVASGVFGTAYDAGSPIGTVNLSNSKQEFVLLLNGLKNNATYKNVLTASFDTASPNYFVNVFNTDPTKIEAAGHFLYTHYDIAASMAVVTGSGLVTAAAWGGLEPSALLLTTALSRNSGSATTSTSVGVPNLENFEDRFNAAFTPWIVSQKFGSSNVDLFKFHTLSDGAVGSGEFKITIENIAASSKANNKFGTFDVLVRRFNDNDLNPQVVESFRGCSLDPTADTYVAKRIGDLHTYFDFDSSVGSQKIVVDGDYPNVSNFVRIEMSSQMQNGTVDSTALPTGFRGIHHLLTSGSSVAGATSILTGSFSADATDTSGILPDMLARVVQPPLPLRQNISTGAAPKKNSQTAFTWGAQFEFKDSTSLLNKNEKIDASLLSFAKWFPNYHTSWQNVWVGNNPGVADVGGAVLDADRFNNNFFTLERVQVITGSNNRPDPQQWSAATYRRNGTALASLSDRDGNANTHVRFLNPATDFADVSSQKYLKFTLPMIGGFDGVNIFDVDKTALNDNALRREMDDTAQGGSDGPTVVAFRKAVDLMEAKQDVDIQLLAIPGIRHPVVTDYALESTERRFDALYILDIEEKDEVNTFITGSQQNVSVANTINAFAGRALDSSFAAAYFPDVVIQDVATQTNVKAPASAVVLGAMALNDAIGFPWYAPAGFSRGALKSALYPAVELLQQNRDDLYSVDINPIIGNVSADSGVTVFGQKTLLAAQSALDRVNVRRLLIDIRRKVRDVARTFLFEPNQAATIAAFNREVQPILSNVQAQGGLDRFKVLIDTTTTTQADIENNTIRGRIFLQPTRSAEFVSLDFAVSNSIQ
jgi:phage tail sheath protein FI